MKEIKKTTYLLTPNDSLAFTYMNGQLRLIINNKIVTHPDEVVLSSTDTEGRSFSYNKDKKEFHIGYNMKVECIYEYDEDNWG